jgi:hypothetical protein
MRKLLVFALFATTLLALGCKKDDTVTPVRERSYLHILSALPADSFDLKLDYYNSNDVVIKDFVFGRNFPIAGYADLEASDTPDEFGNGKLYVLLSNQRFIDRPVDTVMPPKVTSLVPDEKSTICFADSMGTVNFLKIKDEYSIPNDTTFAVRFINLSNAHPTASLGSSNAVINIGGVAFWTNSEFQYFPHGQYDVQLIDANGAVVGTVSQWLGGGSAYTFYAAGNTLGFFLH